MTIDKWSIGGSAREPAREPERAGSARLGILASREKRIGSARSRLASREFFFQPYSLLLKAFVGAGKNVFFGASSAPVASSHC